MLGNQTSGKEGGVQGVLTVVCMYIYMLDIVCIRFRRETQAWPSSIGQLSSLMLPELPLIQYYYDRPY